jgi:hypothetical protein
VQSADNVKLCHRLRVARCSGLKRLIQCHGVGAGRVFFSSESAQATGGNTNIRWIDVPVYIEIGLVAMHAFPDIVRQPPDGENVGGTVQSERVIRIKTRACKHFLVNWR